MAQQGIQMDRSKFCCSICLDILRDPVTIPCGHNYCMGCIKNCWDLENQKGIHRCPQCRQTFTPRPAVVKNTMLAELVEELEKTGLQAAPPDHCYAGPGDVACDVCTGRKLKALKFCQVCLVSYCEQHLQRHYDVAPLRKHKLVETSTELQEDILKQEVPEILLTVTKVDVLLSTSPEPTTRDDYLKYSHQIKLDPNTAHVRMSLSEGNRKVTATQEEQLYPPHPERFISPWQVLSTEGLTGRCYWEVEWSGEAVSIAVSYKNINRGGSYSECRFGNNDKSWALKWSINRYEFKHNNITTPIKGPRSSRVGVYLDYRAGTLCFYSVSKTMTLLHRVQTTFTQPLYPGVWFRGCYGDTAELCLLK